MVVSINPEPEKNLFQELLSKTIKELNIHADNDPDRIEQLRGNKLEPYVRDAMTELAVGTDFEGSIKLISGQKFPDIVANNFSINVIAAVWQILSPLFMGAQLKVYSDEIEWDPYKQFELAAADNVTVIEVIPSVLKAYLFVLDEGKNQVKLENLRKIALTTEEIKPFLVNK